MIVDGDCIPSSHCDVKPKQDKVTDNINPDHYKFDNLQTIDYIKGVLRVDYEGFLAGNVIKYISRHRYKHNVLEDLEKCRWYLERLIEYIKNDRR